MGERRRKLPETRARSKREAVPVRTIDVPNRLDALTAIYEGLESFSRDAGLPDRARRTLLLVVEELFTNIVRYGYEGDVSDRITITVERRDSDIRLVVCDRAKPFDTAAQPMGPAADEQPADKPVGGLGLFLVHEFARSLTVRRVDGANITELRLAVDAS